MIKASKWVTDNFYLLLSIASLIACRFPGVPFIPIIIIFVAMYAPVLLSKKVCLTNTGSIILFLLGGYIVLSLITYLIDSIPLSIFVNGLYCYVFPVIFFFLALHFSDEEIEKFRKVTFYGLMLAYVIGMYLYFAEPEWYMTWKTSKLEGLFEDRTENYLTAYRFFTSYFTHPYFVGYTAIWVVSYLCSKISKAEKFPILLFVMLIITIFAEFLTQQRASAVIVVAILFWYTFKEIKKRKFRITYIVFLAVLLVSYYIIKYYDELEMLLTRYMTILDGTILNDGREEQWHLVYKNFDNYIFGEGFNSVGHYAMNYGLPVIADGEFYKDFYEYGIVGCLLLYSFFFKTIWIAFRKRKFYEIELPVVIGFIAIKYGANPFEMTNIIPLYWFSAGVLWRTYNKHCRNASLT